MTFFTVFVSDVIRFVSVCCSILPLFLFLPSVLFAFHGRAFVCLLFVTESTLEIARLTILS
jgi:hypothetical protein